MKLLNYLFFVICCGLLFNTGAVYAKQASHKAVIQPAVNRKEVQDISAIKIHSQHTETIAFFIDADEVLFTTTIVNGVPTLVRLYDDLEGVFSEIRKQGHRVFILTYNKASEIRRKLLTVKLDETYFDGILSCEMQGDILTSKGSLLRKFVKESGASFDSFVFIDNFPPFVKDVENVAKELNLKLHTYLCTGYIPLYHEYVYHHLRKLQDGLAAGRDVNHELTRIAKSLAKHRIDIATFLTAYPDAESFIKWAQENELIWPYLTYL